MKGVPANPEFEELLRNEFGVEEFPEDAPPIVDIERHFELAKRLRDEGYRLYVYCVASHWPAAEPPKPKEGEEPTPKGEDYCEIATGLRKVGKPPLLATWRLRVPMSQAIPSLTSLFAGADWQEREQFDLFGVDFAGHPDLRRIMLPEDWEGHPLRKDYAIDTRCAPWR
jgi:NADH:ubiquinone oxidoreductase subunit C